MTPAALAKQASSRLRKQTDRERAEYVRPYYESHKKLLILGMPVPDQRKIARDLYSEVRKAWSYDDAFEFAEAMVNKKHFEERAVGIYFLGRFRKHFPKTMLRNVKPWFAKDRLNTWALVDPMCGDCLHPLLDTYPELVAQLEPWVRARNMWVRRAAAVALIRRARYGHDLDAAYGVATALIGEDEDLLHKAQGWLLREAGTTDMPRLEAFLVKNGSTMARTAIRYAIEKYPAPKRKSLLARTRS